MEEEPQTKQKDTSNKENVEKNKKRKIEKTTDVTTKKQKLDTNEREENNVEKKEKTNKSMQKQSVTRVKNAPALIKEKKSQKPKADNIKTAAQKPKSVNTEVTQRPKTAKTEDTQKSKTEKHQNIRKPKTEVTEKPKSEQLKRRNPAVVAKRVKNFQKQLSPKTEKVDKNSSFHTPKKVKFVLKNNSMQGTMEYYKSVRKSPNIPFDSSKRPFKTNLKPSTPSPINPFFKKKLRKKN